MDFHLENQDKSLSSKLEKANGRIGKLKRKGSSEPFSVEGSCFCDQDEWERYGEVQPGADPVLPSTKCSCFGGLAVPRGAAGLIPGFLPPPSEAASPSEACFAGIFQLRGTNDCW